MLHCHVSLITMYLSYVSSRFSLSLHLFAKTSSRSKIHIVPPFRFLWCFTHVSFSVVEASLRSTTHKLILFWLLTFHSCFVQYYRGFALLRYSQTISPKLTLISFLTHLSFRSALPRLTSLRYSQTISLSLLTLHSCFILFETAQKRFLKLHSTTFVLKVSLYKAQLQTRFI